MVLVALGLAEHDVRVVLRLDAPAIGAARARLRHGVVILAARRFHHQLLPAGGDGVRVDGDVGADVKADVGRVEHGVDGLGTDEVAPPRVHHRAAREEQIALGMRGDDVDLAGAVVQRGDLYEVREG